MMNPKTLAPQLQPPVDRVASGQLPSALAELSEAELSDTLRSDVIPATAFLYAFPELMTREEMCSYDGDDE